MTRGGEGGGGGLVGGAAGGSTCRLSSSPGVQVTSRAAHSSPDATATLHRVGEKPLLAVRSKVGGGGGLGVERRRGWGRGVESARDGEVRLLAS